VGKKSSRIICPFKLSFSHQTGGRWQLEAVPIERTGEEKSNELPEVNYEQGRDMAKIRGEGWKGS